MSKSKKSSSKSGKSSSKSKKSAPSYPEEWETHGAVLSSSSREPGGGFLLSGWEYLKHHAWDDAYASFTEKTASESDSRDRTLLHVAAAADAPLSLIEKLIELNPSALRFPDSLGKLPLHYSAEAATSMVMLVVLAWTCGVEKIPLGLPREPLEDSG